MTDYLGEMLGVGVGDTIEVAVLEGRRDRLQVPVAGLVHEYFGANAYMSLAGLNRLLREADAISGAYLAVDPAARDALVRALDEMPRVASVTRSELLMQNFEQLMGDVAGVFEWFIAVLAGVIAFGIVYNSARIALAERAWELASLRVLGYSKSEVAYVLVGELALLTALAIAPGFLIGTGFAHLMLRSYDSDLYRLPVVIAPSTYGVAAVTVLAAAALSAWLITRRLNRLDMVSALKEAS